MVIFFSILNILIIFFKFSNSVKINNNRASNINNNTILLFMGKMIFQWLKILKFYFHNFFYKKNQILKHIFNIKAYIK